MRKNFIYAMLLLAAGACQRADVSPVFPSATPNSADKTKPEAVMGGKQETPTENSACGTNPQIVRGYTAKWAFENGSSTVYTYQTLYHNIVKGSRGNYPPPLRMRVSWDYTLCLGPSSADYMRVYLHSPDGSIKLVAQPDPSLVGYAIITIPQVVHSADLYSYADDSAPGNYYVQLEYGLNGPLYTGLDGTSQGTSDTSGKPLVCGNVVVDSRQSL
jgi:hypothetical protein